MKAAIVLGAVGLLATACGGFDGGNPLRTRPVTVGDPTDPNDNNDNDNQPDTDASTIGAPVPPSPSSPEAGTPTTPPASEGAFQGAPPYVGNLGATTRKPQHNFAGNTPLTNPAGRPCQMCHGPAGPAPRFAFAGTVYTDTGATQPSPNVEVRIIDAQGQVMATSTDADGNYFIKLPAGGAIAFPVKAGVRDATTTRLMKAGSTNGNCNTCHKVAGTSTPLAIP